MLNELAPKGDSWSEKFKDAREPSYSFASKKITEGSKQQPVLQLSSTKTVQILLEIIELLREMLLNMVLGY